MTDSLSQMKRIRVQQGKDMYPSDDDNFLAEVERLRQLPAQLECSDTDRLIAMVRQRDAEIAALRVAVVDVGMKDAEIAELKRQLVEQMSGCCDCPTFKDGVKQNDRLRKQLDVAREALGEIAQHYSGNGGGTAGKALTEMKGLCD